MISPILIASPARTGTTMMANLLHGHGAWIGEAGISKTSHVQGNVGAENLKIKRFLRKLVAEVGHTSKIDMVPSKKQSMVDRSDFIGRIGQLAPSDTPWLVKTSLVLDFNEVFQDVFPDARWLLMKRAPEDVVQSIKNHPVMRRRVGLKTMQMEAAFKRQEAVFKTASWVRKVSADHVVNSYVSAREVVEWCGFTFDHNIYDRIVKRKEWGKWKSA